MPKRLIECVTLLARYFAWMKRDEAIIGKNNQDLIDDIYGPFLLRIGITPRCGRHDTETTLNRGAAIMAERLGPHYQPQPDVVLSRLPENVSDGLLGLTSNDYCGSGQWQVLTLFAHWC